MTCHRVALFVVLAGSVVGIATAAQRCDPTGADAADVAAARAAVAAQCDCATAATHGAYVRCARDAAAAALANRRCKGTVVRCAGRSTCGRPGAVACCRTRAGGAVRGTIRRSADRCRPPRGGAACVSPAESVCDACDAGGCVTPTTTTTTTTTLPAPVCGDGVVDPGEQCDGAAGTCLPPLVGTCRPAGLAGECECCTLDACLPPLGIGCCDPEAFCLAAGFSGTCFSVHCTEPWQSCGFPTRCENGLCCTPLGENCAVPDVGYFRPCCGEAECNPATFACCLPAGANCTSSGTCCGGSCSGGTCT
jgi:hypothetical protein